MNCLDDMKMNKEFKDSNINWIGEIPTNWKVGAVKHCFKFKVGFTPPTANTDFYDNDGFEWVTISDLSEKVVLNSKNKISQLAVDTYSKEIVPKGSLLYSFKLSVGKVAFAGKDIFTNEAIFSILPDDNLELSYYYYCLPTILIYNANHNIYGAKIFNQEVIKNSRLPIPPKEEQTKIAQYLDNRTGIIDDLISKKQKLIEQLKEKRQAIINEAVTKGLNPNAKMKASGIEWLGEIPEHWVICQMKHIGEVKGRIGFKGYAVDDLVDEETPGRAIVLGGTNIMKSGVISYEKLTFLSNFKYLESPEIMLRGGEILITKVGAGVGENAIYSYHSERVTINPNVMLFVPNAKTKSEYINYFLMSDFVKQNIIMESQKSGAQPAINQSFIKGMLISLPPKDEQEQIIDYIFQSNSKIDLLNKEIILQIEKLKEYRQSLIFEAVTGKIDVREWQPIVN